METVNRSATRKSLPMTDRDLRDLDVVRRSVAHRAALSSLSREVVDEDSSEAAVLHAIMEAGMKAVTEQIEEAGYAQIAAEMDTPARKAVARRRRPAWVDE